MKYLCRENRPQNSFRRRNGKALSVGGLSRRSSKQLSTPKTKASEHSSPRQLSANSAQENNELAGQLEQLFYAFRELSAWMRYSEDCYLTCLWLLHRYQRSELTSQKMGTREVVAAIFLLYSKMYEYRQLLMVELQTLTGYTFSSEYWIEVEAHVLERLEFDLNLPTVPITA